MFIQRKKVALLLLIFIAIPITIAFSAFKLSASKAAIAADENKTEYTLSDFGVAVPDDGLDFNLSNYGTENDALKLSVPYVDENKVLKFSFAIKFTDLSVKQEIIVKFSNSANFQISLTSNRMLSVTFKEKSIDSDTINLKSFLKDYNSNDFVIFKFEIGGGVVSSFCVKYCNRECAIPLESTNVKVVSPALRVYCVKGSGARLYDAYHSVTVNNGRGTTAEITVEHGDILDEASLPTTESYEKNGEAHNFLGWKCDGVTFDLSTPIIKNIEIIAEYDSNVAEETLVTVLDENGKEISEIDKTTLSYEEIIGKVQTPEKKFIGFEYDGKLYQTTAEIEDLKNDETVIARTITLFMEYGARIRTIEPFGIRFAAVASYSAADYGIMLTTKDIAKNSDLFTLENLKKTGANVKIANKKQTQKEFREVRDDNKGLSNFAIALIVKEYNYNRVFASRAFAEIEYCNGETKTIYSDFSEDNCRSIYDVAKVGLEKDKSHHELYRKYCNGVIDIKIEGKNISLLYTSNLYTVNFSEEGTQLILTLEPNKECAIPKNICISINGERVEFEGVGGKIFKVDLSKISS